MDLTDRQRRILLAEQCLGIYGVQNISRATGISINHVYSELSKMRQSQVRSTYSVLGEIDNKLYNDNLDSTVDKSSNDQSIAIEHVPSNDHKYNNDYLDIYNKYPKRTEKMRGEREYKKLIKKGFAKEFLLQCVMNYLDSGTTEKVRDRDPQYIKSLAVFFGRDQHFLDYQKQEETVPEEPYQEEDNSIANLLNWHE